jgi:hypothetical protein
MLEKKSNFKKTNYQLKKIRKKTKVNWVNLKQNLKKLATYETLDLVPIKNFIIS